MVKEEKYDEGEKQKNGANPCGRTHTHTQYFTTKQREEVRLLFKLISSRTSEKEVAI